MREYGKVAPQFWTGVTGKKLKAAGPETVIVALYLMTCQHANMIGLYYLPKMYIAHDTGLDMEGASKGLRRAIEAGFCTYDEASEHVFVHKMVQYQVAESLAAKDKRCKGIENELRKAPKGALVNAFLEMYVDAFHIKNTSPFEAPSKPLRSQEQEQEQEQEQDKDTLPHPADEDGRHRAQKDFDETFWPAYPRKVGKKDALKAFMKLKFDREALKRVMAALETQKQTEDWRRDEGRFIPHPATWLNGRRWEDEISANAEPDAFDMRRAI